MSGQLTQSAEAANKAAEAASGQVAATREVATAAIQSANAASEQVQISREALVTTDRAFVFLERMSEHWYANKETEKIVEWIFYPVWRNIGHTPTVRGVACGNSWVGVDAGELPKDFDFPDYGTPDRIMIGPDLTRHGIQLRIPIATMHKIRDGTAHAYMWGWVDYDTVFPTDQLRHRSEFCVEIEVLGNPDYKEGGFAFRAHGPFNGFDAECFRKPQAYADYADSAMRFSQT